MTWDEASDGPTNTFPNEFYGLGLCSTAFAVVEGCNHGLLLNLAYPQADLAMAYLSPQFTQPLIWPWLVSQLRNCGLFLNLALCEWMVLVWEILTLIWPWLVSQLSVLCVDGSAAANPQADMVMAYFSIQDLIWPWLVSQFRQHDLCYNLDCNPQADLAMACSSTQRKDIFKLIWLWLVSQLSNEWMVLLLLLLKLMWPWPLFQLRQKLFLNSGSCKCMVLLLLILKLIWPWPVLNLGYSQADPAVACFTTQNLTILIILSNYSLIRHDYLSSGFVPTSGVYAIVSGNTCLLCLQRKVCDSTTL
ncbi:hypothetical protein JAAARDRAFT_49493 [Jaapia argillacea MUCL 33604]|uniref:Uncharacterized protein n=1 Tax=Jaapia argillacea MUCL 33604 TaxID=933084 RepID=A0A067PV39_9AGAM|nr:hypothetical protein JAAARDRAFT_49493 [Jaapia argillacea MUCL 33604]